MRFIALVDQDPTGGSWGAWFPELPGCVAQAGTLDDLIAHATENLAEHICDEKAAGRVHAPGALADVVARADVRKALAGGDAMVYVPLIRLSGRAQRANLSIDEGLLESVDEAAARRGMTRSSWLASAAWEALRREG